MIILSVAVKSAAREIAEGGGLTKRLITDLENVAGKTALLTMKGFLIIAMLFPRLSQKIAHFIKRKMRLCMASINVDYILKLYAEGHCCKKCKNYQDDDLNPCSKIVGAHKRAEGIVRYGYDCFERNEDDGDHQQKED